MQTVSSPKQKRVTCYWKNGKLAEHYAPSLLCPALFAAAHLFFIASASRFRTAGLIPRRLRGADVRKADGSAVPVCACLDGRPRFFGAVPSSSRTCAICWVSVL